MLFNSFPFLLAFLPLVVLGFLVARSISMLAATGWLLAASLAFYGWWRFEHLQILILSIAFNYVMGSVIARAGSRRKLLLGLAIGVDLSCLGYLKYAGFIAENINAACSTHLSWSGIALPLGISFFTFTQITFLVDSYRNQVKDFNLVRYGLFVSYFPHLIAGPIIHHAEVIPQFGDRDGFRLTARTLSIGLTIFLIGLFKKTVLADSLAPYANYVFDHAWNPEGVSCLQAWVGSLSYTLEIYFDFSGYSDMAIGLSMLFGVKLPENFNSPYKATSIIEFWRCWHMTLSRLLKEYLYIPLGGNRKGPLRRHANLLITMLLGGLWHGPAWTFLLWGAAHGVLLSLNHVWNSMQIRFGITPTGGGALRRVACLVVTFACINATWVLFRAPSLESAVHMFQGMVGWSGESGPVHWPERSSILAILDHHGVLTNHLGTIMMLIAAGLAWVWIMPNTYQMMTAARGEPVAQIRWYHWKPSVVWGITLAAALVLSLQGFLSPTTFLYFNF